jgi:hypothetical protein
MNSDVFDRLQLLEDGSPGLMATPRALARYIILLYFNSFLVI